MNNYNINNEEFINSNIYKDFIKNNPVYGYLSIRAYAANQAIPIPNLKIIISTYIGNYETVFFEGYTNQSGIIEKISLPVPRLDSNNLDAPNKITYKISSMSDSGNVNKTYFVNMYENISVIQNISIVSDMNNGEI